MFEFKKYVLGFTIKDMSPKLLKALKQDNDLYKKKLEESIKRNVFNDH